jgi:hypothetical protein
MAGCGEEDLPEGKGVGVAEEGVQAEDDLYYSIDRVIV